MARPPPTVICAHDEGETTFEICDADAIYAVLHDGKPVKLRKFKETARYLGFKYGKTAFPEPGHALRLAQKLNQVHDTESFTVAVMVVGRTLKV